MSILKPIEGHGAWEFTSPVPCPPTDILASPKVSIEFNETWASAVFSALKALTRPEAYVGTKTDINRCTVDAHNLFSLGGASMPTGSIIPHMLSALPANWLNCDGSSYLRIDYPELYAIIDAVYKTDADHFVTPDLRGRSPIGVGTGSALTARVVNAQGGEETHILTVAELASHNHNRNTDGLSELAMWNKTPANANFGGTGGQQAFFGTVTGNSGSGNAHNNMPPFRVLKFAVVAS